MRKFIMLIAMALTLCATNKAEAQDFSAVNADGDTIWYNIINGTTNLEVTYSVLYDNEYTGTVNIPSEFTLYGITYNVTSIGEYAFDGCTGLTSIDIPNSVSTIGYEAFSGCTGLTSIDIPNSVTTIGSGAFADCTGLTSVVLGDSLLSIQSETFYNCSALSSVVIGSSVTSIEYMAFLYCTSLSSITIPSSVDTIEEEAFLCCYFLDTVVSLAQEPPVLLGSGWFESTPMDRTLVVSCGSEEAYRASAWRACFLNIAEQSYASTIEATVCQGSDYTDNGFSVLNAQESGVFTRTLTSESGCDSTVTLNLTVRPAYEVTFHDFICQGNDYTEHGFNLTDVWAGDVHTQNLQSVNGCDSIVTLVLIVNPICDTTIEASISAGGSYTENGFNLMDVQESGTFTQTLTAMNGCDSIVVLNLTVNSSLAEADGKSDLSVRLFPNPAEEFATLSLDNLVSSAEVVVCDLQGRVVSRQSIAAGTQNVALDLTNLSSGTYSVTITSVEGVITRKLIKR